MESPPHGDSNTTRLKQKGGKMMKATLRLFNALPIKERKGVFLQPEELLLKTIPKGFVFSSDVIADYPYHKFGELIELVEKEIGIDSSQANQTFHKSWAKVRDASIEQLVIEQWAHYLTTYGKADPLGYVLEKGITQVPGDFHLDRLYDGNYVYIPQEILDIPNINMEDVKLTVIKGYTKEELKDKLLALLGSGIALKEDTLCDVIDIAIYVGMEEWDIANIKNKEVKAILYDNLSMFPKSPVEFLRYCVYVATDQTLLIKSKAVIAKIKEGKNIKIVKLFQEYDAKYGFEVLAEIFYRFKPIFLAFRTNQAMKIYTNKIRRFARTCHYPMKEDYLNTVTAVIKRGGIIFRPQLEQELKKVNTFRKIRLAYALKFRTKDVKSILYRIRNGKAYATEFVSGEASKVLTKATLSIVLDSIIKDVAKNVKGKKIYIPDYINYTLPATEKQFAGNFPSGTYVDIKEDMLFGVHWKNVSDKWIDLDLSLLSADHKYGWDGAYRDENRNILYSGDVTTAPKPKGATELFYVKRQLKDEFIFFVNYYNYDKDIPVPFKIIVAKQKVSMLNEGCMVNPNNIVVSLQSEISQKQKILGLLITTTTGSKFYFVETSIGGSITSSNSAFAEHSRQYLIDFYQDSIELKDILVKAGAKLVKNMVDEPKFMKDEIDINLSPENLEKDTILNLLKGA